MVIKNPTTPNTAPNAGGASPTQSAKNYESTAQQDNRNPEDPGMENDIADLPDGHGSHGDKADRKKRNEVPKDETKAIKRFLEDRRLAMFPDDYLIINDIFLGEVPTTAIRIEKDTDVFIAETLRSSAPIVQPLGRNNIKLTLSLAFKPGREQSVKLRRLVGELRHNPLVYIYNNKIRKDLGVGIGISGAPVEEGEEDNRNTIFILESGTLRNSTEHIGTIVLDLSLFYFNYKPYSKHFWYNTTLPGVTTELNFGTQENQDFETGIELTDLQGYEASGYSLDIESEKLLDEIKSGILDTLSPEAAGNLLPTPFPHTSDAFLYYADHLTDLMPAIPNYTTDYVGFEVEKLEKFIPPKQGSRVGNSVDAGRNAIGEYFLPPPIYDADAQSPEQKKHTDRATASSYQAARTTQAEYEDYVEVGKSISMTFVNNWGKEITFKMSSRGLPREGRRLFAQFFAKPVDKRDPAWSEEYAIDNQLATLLFDVGLQYPGKKIRIKSCVRLGTSSQHAPENATAVDIEVAGVSYKELFVWGAKRVTKLKTGASIYYEFDRWVHLDARYKSNPQVLAQIAERDRNGNPVKPRKFMKYSGGQKFSMGLKYIRQYLPDIADAMEKMSGEIDYVQFNDTENLDALDDQEHAAQDTSGNEEQQSNDTTAGKSAETKNKVAESAEQQKQKADPSHKDKANNASNADTSRKDPQTREEWIRETEREERVSYYDRDSKIKNIFIRKIRRTVSSDPLRRSDPTNLPGMVCSGVSVTFGHRICPIKLLGQDTPTWQFLGAGNKTGSIAFTFSGPTGKESSTYLQKMIQYSHENARKFSAIVPESGSMRILYNDFETNEINSILALAGIKDIAVTNIDIANVPGTVDQHQMVIQFVNQEFTEESYKRRFSTDAGTKRRMVSGFMNFLVKEEPPDLTTSRTKVQTPFADRVDGWFREDHQFPPNMPWWLGELIVEALGYTREANQDAPPVDWKLNTQQLQGAIARGSAAKNLGTWRDVYSLWGAGDIIEGWHREISSNDRNGPAFTVPGVDNKLTWWGDYYEAAGYWEKNGAPETNNVHARIYNRWLRNMEIVIKKALSHMASDPENFDRFFPSIREEFMGGLINQLGECYADMNLPQNPATNEEVALSLPPEFYIYDDAFEGNSFDQTEQQFLKAGANIFMKNEMNSIQQIMRRRLLGGSYISVNSDKIAQNRRGWNENFGAEWGFHWGNAALYEGTKTWEPVHYRSKVDSGYDETKTKAWVGNTAIALQADSAEPKDTQPKFLEKVLGMSNYIGEGRQWNINGTGGLGNREPVEYSEVIRNVYGQNNNELLFGPNIRYGKADKVLRGEVLTATDIAVRDQVIYEEALERVKKTGKTQALRGEGTLNSTWVSTKTGGTTVTHESELVSHLVSFSRGGLQFGGILGDIGGGIRSFLGLDVLDKYVPGSISAEQLRQQEKEVNKIEGKEVNAGQIKGKVKVGKGAKKAARAAVNKARDTDHSFGAKEEDAAKTAANAATGILLGRKLSDQSVRRAFPTFKIYFIEDDSEEHEIINNQVIRAFDDFYSYSSIQEIKITRSRKTPADFAVIRMTNIGGKLLRRRFGERDEQFNRVGPSSKTGQSAEYATGIYADTDLEHPFERMLLQDGVKVQIRLGYASNPDHLESVFLGQIVEVGPSEDQRIIEIVCQGYGAELDAVELNPLSDGAVFYSAQQALSAAIISPHIVNFGRQSKTNKFNPAEIRTLFTGGQGRGPVSEAFNPLEAIRQAGQNSYRESINEYRFKNDPQDDNIYAPPPTVYTTWWERFWDNACFYRPIKQTAWDIFKEHELRHPGYISLAVPYGHSARMTMFFGPKYQHYWANPISPLELYLSENAEQEIQKLRGLDRSKLSEQDKKQWEKDFKQLAKENKSLATAILSSLAHSLPPTSVGFQLGKLFGRYRPFRNFFYVDSEHQIICNEIRTSRDGTYNEVEIRYFEDEELLDVGTSEDTISTVVKTTLAGTAGGAAVGAAAGSIALGVGTLAGAAAGALGGGAAGFIGGIIKILNDDEEKEAKLRENLQRLAEGHEGVLAVKLDENIPEYQLRQYTGQFPSCITDFMAKRYAQGIFLRHLRDTYKGTLTLMGNEEIKPYDMIFLNDRVTDMKGPIEVEAVTHVFNREWGFITMVTPDLCLAANEFWSVGIMDLMGTMFQAGYGEDAQAVEIATAVINPFAYLSLIGALKLIQWTQDGAPVVSSPLSLGGKPFVSVVLGPQHSSIFGGITGKWEQLWDDTANFWNKFNFGEDLFDAKANFKTRSSKFFGTIGTSDLEPFEQ